MNLNDPSIVRISEAGAIPCAVTPHQLAFGFERLGLIALRYPYFCAVVVIALMIAAAFGIVRIKVDDSWSQLLRSNTPAYEQYQEVT